MFRTSLTRRAVLLAGAALSACGGDASPEVESVTVDDHGPIFRSLTIRLSQPADVEVEYGTADGRSLRVRTRADDRSVHVVALPRLRALQTYGYRIRAEPDRMRSFDIVGEFTTGALPADLAAIRFTPSGEPSMPLLFLSMRSQFTGGVIVDEAGQVVWYGRSDGAPQGAVRRANGHWALVSGYGIEEFDELGRVVDRLAHGDVPGVRADIHHGVAESPDRAIVFIRFEPREHGGQTWYGEALWRWNGGSSTPVRLWSCWDFLDPATDRGARSVPSDWLHANHVSYGATGSVLVSFHFLDQIISIAPDFHSLQWRLGGPGSSFALEPIDATSGQHSPREIAPDRVLCFDNGFARQDGSRYSRMIEFQLDLQSGTALSAWQYRPSPDIWATVISSVRRLPNGNTLGLFGTPSGILGSTGPIAAHEVTASGALVATMLIEPPAGSTVFQGDPLLAVADESPTV